jgi:hypothetical protein
MASLGEKAHETASFCLHGTTLFGNRQNWVVTLGSETSSFWPKVSLLNETVSFWAREVINFLFLPSASPSSSRSGAFFEIFSSSGFDTSSSGSSSSHGAGYE